ncbi:MAG: hypothetical protein ACXWEL_08630, partial [Solirubrobacterales bacterium]
MLRELSAWAAHGSAEDRLITLTEGVIVSERLEARAEAVVRVSHPGPEHALVEVEVAEDERAPLRSGVSWQLAPEERLTGLGARHGLDFDQRGRRIQLGADRRYTGPDCPEEMLEQGGIPQGDYAPAPWLLSSAGYAVWA